MDDSIGDIMSGLNLNGVDRDLLTGITRAIEEWNRVNPNKKAHISSGFRTFKEQHDIRVGFGYVDDNEMSGHNGKQLAARPGHSQHEIGDALDVGIKGGSKEDYRMFHKVIKSFINNVTWLGETTTDNVHYQLNRKQPLVNIDDTVKKKAKEYGADEIFLQAFINEVSGGDYNYRNDDRIGIMGVPKGLFSYAYEDMGIGKTTSPFDPDFNMNVGIKGYMTLLEKLSGNSMAAMSMWKDDEFANNVLDIYSATKNQDKTTKYENSPFSLRDVQEAGIMLFKELLKEYGTDTTGNTNIAGDVNRTISNVYNLDKIKEGYIADDEYKEYKNYRVIDGDTVEVDIDGTMTKIRAFGMDAPESSQPYGDVAKIALESYLQGGFQMKRIGGSSYGRNVGKIQFKDATTGQMLDLSAEMIRNGHAWWYRKFDATEELKSLSEIAKKNKIGLWNSNEQPIDPRVWRSQYSKESYNDQPQTISRADFETSKARIDEFDPIINKAANEYGVDPKLLKAIIFTESRGIPTAKSGTGAEGLMQLTGATQHDQGVTDPFDPEQNIMGGARLLSGLYKLYNGDTRKILAAYNKGVTGIAVNGITPEVDRYTNMIQTIRQAM